LGEEIEIAKQLLIGLLERMGIKTEVEGFLKEDDIYLEIKSDQEGILIGKHGRTLESIQMLINRMVNKRLNNPMRVVLDINHYKKRRADSLVKMASQLGEKAKRTGKAITVGTFNARDRRIIHVALQGDTSIKTESMGEGATKKIIIIPKK
jgi:spoIIIJ-associated protein